MEIAVNRIEIEIVSQVLIPRHMRFQAGAKLGPYEIEEPLVAGGTGEVYRARDTRLDRRVAIKVLPDELAADETVRARFEREATAISSLSHPNISTLHDVGNENGTDFLEMERHPDTSRDVMRLDLESLDMEPLIQTPFLEVLPSFGPTADWIVYQSDATGRFEVYVQKITGAGGRWQISTDGGGRAAWSHDGRTIYYLWNGTVYAVDVEVGESLVARIPEPLFDLEYRGRPMRPYDVTPDGSRFVFVLAQHAGDASAPMTLVQNWTRMLER